MNLYIAHYKLRDGGYREPDLATYTDGGYYDTHCTQPIWASTKKSASEQLKLIESRAYAVKITLEKENV